MSAPIPEQSGLASNNTFLSPNGYDDDAASIHSVGSGRSCQDPDSDDDELQLRARNSRELRAHDRIMLMEDEETEKLVSTAFKHQQRRLSRRISSARIPNPFKAIHSAGRSRSGSPSFASVDGVSRDREDRRRPTGRRQEKPRAAAHSDEDKRLMMYDMEEGELKHKHFGSHSSSDGDDDSDDLDRQRLLSHAAARDRRKLSQTWHRALLAGIVVLLCGALASLVTLIMTTTITTTTTTTTTTSHGGRQSWLLPLSNGTDEFRPTTIIISLDGFRADFLKRGLSPRLNEFVREGVSPLYMTPSFPSVTFPNHHTLATGLYPEAHGIVGNTFWDPQLKEDFYYTDPSRSLDPRWWGGEPFWVTAERAGVRTAIHMWPGSEAHIMGVEPTYLDRYNGKESLSNKAARVLEFLDMPASKRPQIIAAYVPTVDTAGHRYGPNSTETDAAIRSVDGMLDHIFGGLKLRNLTAVVNVIVVSDHGAATTDMHRVIQLEDLVDVKKLARIEGFPLVGMRLKNDEDLQPLYNSLRNKSLSNPHWDVYLRDMDMPSRFHFRDNNRIAPLWIIPEVGWAVVRRDEYDVAASLKNNIPYMPRGMHGYDNEHPLMRAIFVARGPAFPHSPFSKVDPFLNTNVYNMLCDSVGIRAAPNNGTMHLPLKVIGSHDASFLEAEPPAQSLTLTDALADSQTITSSVSSVSNRPTRLTTISPPAWMGPVPDATGSVVSPTQTVTTSTASPSVDDALVQTSDHPQEAENDANSDQSLHGAGRKIASWWGWLKGTTGELWTKLTGGPPESHEQELSDSVV